MSNWKWKHGLSGWEFGTWAAHVIADNERVICHTTNDNAPLIAAAPDMLAMLERLSSGVELYTDNNCDCIDDDNKCEACELWESFISILRKARGETNG